MYNKVIVMGRITNDLELKTTPSGTNVLSFGLAVERNYAAKGEERKTDFFDVVAWRSNAEFIAKYFSKGRMILIEGTLETRTYTDKNGNNVKVTDIVAERTSFTGEAKPSGSGSPTADNAPKASTPTISGGSTADFADMVAQSDDDYPF